MTEAENTTVFVGMGSNVDRETNLNRGLEQLRDRYGKLLLSPVYECPAVGFDGSAFYNGALCFDTSETAVQVAAALREIEDSCGRDRSLPKFSPRTLDLDLLLYGEAVINEDGLQIPRADILEYDFVLKPLVDIAPDFIHPVRHRSLAELWEDFDKSESQLTLVCPSEMPVMV